MSDELAELQREWRNSVTTSIRSTELKMDLILDQVTSVRSESVSRQQLKELVDQITVVRGESVSRLQLKEVIDQLALQNERLSTRVQLLEADKSKLIGAAVVLNFIGGVVIYLVTKFWK